MQSKGSLKVLALVAMLSLSGALGAATTEVAGLSPSSFVDTETVTNVLFNAGVDGVRRFCLSIELEASISNNVEVAFGRDVNTNGVLDRFEADLKVGWDAGEWFFRDRRAGVERHVARGEGRRRLDWQLRLDVDRMPVALVAADANGSVFGGAVTDADGGGAASLPSTLFDADWNLMRVTTRGTSDPDGTVSATLGGWGFRVILR
ncbi:MAG: hypothetical protein MJ249_15490 [Kiritimatiellae bacterium]|nr:hypothetical protein [Kiritimatiellia bacterium]